MIATITTTAREALAGLGITDPEAFTDSRGAGWDFDRPATVSPAWNAATGRLQAMCGSGECLFMIRWTTGYRPAAYVVRDDTDGQRWDVANRRWLGMSDAHRAAWDCRTAYLASATEAGTTYRPHPRIRIVQAG